MNVMTHRHVLQFFSLSETEIKMEHNLHHADTHHDSLMYQKAAAEDILEMNCLLYAGRETVEHIMEEEQAHSAQVAALCQMQLHAMQKVQEQEKNWQRLSAMLVEDQAVLQTSTKIL